MYVHIFLYTQLRPVASVENVPLIIDSFPHMLQYCVAHGLPANCRTVWSADILSRRILQLLNGYHQLSSHRHTVSRSLEGYGYGQRGNTKAKFRERVYGGAYPSIRALHNEYTELPSQTRFV